MRLLPETDLYGITDSRHSLGRPVDVVVDAMLSGGIRIIQYREKDKKTGEMLAECLTLRALTRRYGACFIVNDHVDLALLCEADGVHVGQDDLPVEAVRQRIGADKIIGLSTHSPEQAADAVARGVSYLGVGPLFATQTKDDVGAPVGLAYLAYVAQTYTLPLVAIGGIKRHNVGEVVAHGARCCCLVTDITTAPDISARIAEIRAAMR